MKDYYLDNDFKLYEEITRDEWIDFEWVAVYEIGEKAPRYLKKAIHTPSERARVIQDFEIIDKYERSKK